MDQFKGCILVVEDDDLLRDVVVQTLEEEDYCILSAKDGAEAINMLQLVRYCVILLDFNLPGIGASGVVDWMRETGSRVPVVLMTGDAHAQEIAVQLGVAGCLEKPFGLDQLLSMVAHCEKQYHPV
ncbi:MAG: response regulator [Chloroflexia bacterium]